MAAGRLVGYVPRDPHAACDPLRRVRHHVEEAWRAHGLRPRAGQAAGASALLRPHQWSGGMLQRATLAAADAHDPPLLIVDEPTSALDADRAHEVLANLRRAARGLLLVSHDLDLVAAYADGVAVCYAGGIVEEGPAARWSPAHATPTPRRCAPRLPAPAMGCPYRCQAVRRSGPPLTRAVLREPLRPGHATMSRRCP